LAAFYTATTKLKFISFQVQTLSGFSFPLKKKNAWGVDGTDTRLTSSFVFFKRENSTRKKKLKQICGPFPAP